MTPAVTLDVVHKTGSNDGGRRHTIGVLHRPGKVGDTRRTAVSAADAEDNGVTTFFNLGPEFGFVGEHAGLLVA